MPEEIQAPTLSNITEAEKASGDLQLRLAGIDTEQFFFERERAGLEAEAASSARQKAQGLRGRASYDSQRLREMDTERQALQAQLQVLAATTEIVDLSQQTQNLTNSLKEGRIAQAQAAFDGLAEWPLWLEKHMPFIQRDVEAAGQADALFQLFRKGNPRALTRINLIARAAESGLTCGRRADVLEMMARVQQSCEKERLRFSAHDQVRTVFPRLDREIVERLSALKFHGIRVPRETNVFAAAQTLADQIDLDPQVVDYLFTRRRDARLLRSDWERRLRVGFCTGHLIWDRPKTVNPKRLLDYNRLIDQEACTKALSIVDRSRGALLATFHSSMALMSRSVFNATFANRIVLDGSGTNTQTISMKDDARAGLFLALRAVLGGKAVLMAPDGRQGQRDHFCIAAGKPVRVAAGAALLAYESGCFSAWYNIVRDGKRFVPVVIEAPKPDKGEDFDSFAQRWLAFYGNQIEILLTGDPRKMSLRGAWWGTLSAWDR
ncbi:MAG TPA: hypothetical protein VGG10_00955 [Rhizomicrobium sp.]